MRRGAPRARQPAYDPDNDSGTETSCSSDDGGIGGATGADKQFTGEGAFTDFMAAFRTEMREARDQGDRKQKFVPSKTAADSTTSAGSETSTTGPDSKRARSTVA